MGDFISHQKVPKIITMAADNGDDRISNLPDEVLCIILSFLPTKFAAATSVLSSRWRYLFLHLPVINLEMNNSNSVQDDQLESHTNEYEDYGDYCHNVIDFIVFWGSLVHRSKVPIKKFYYGLPRVVRGSLPRVGRGKGLDIPIISVASLAISSGIPEVIIDFAGGPTLTNFLSDALKYGKSLTVLKLNRIGVLALPHPVCLPNLKAMELQGLKFVKKPNPLVRLLSGCPSLEELDINVISSSGSPLKVYNCSMNKLTLHLMRGPNRIILDAVNLNSFSYQGPGNKQIVMNAPNLENWEITLCDGRQNFEIFEFQHFRCSKYGPTCYCAEDSKNLLECNLKSLARAKISLPFNWSWNHGETSLLCDDGDNENLPKAFQLMHLLRSVKSLNLSCKFLEVVFYSQGVLPTFTNLSCLEIQVGNFSVEYSATWNAFTRLLESSPNLERIVFDQVIWHLKIDNNNEDLVCVFPDPVPSCISQHLREIEIRSPQGSEFEFKFVEYCVKNGRAFKKMSFGTCSKATMDRIYSLKESMQWREEYCEVVFNRKR